MRVLYFHQHFSTPSGSTGNRSYAFARALADRGHEVTVVCGSYDQGKTGLTGPFEGRKREGMIDGVHVMEFLLPYSNNDNFARRTRTFLRFAIGGCLVALTRQYDVLVASSTPLTAGIPGIVARTLRRKSFVFEVRDLWPELPRAMGVIRNPLVLLLMNWLEWISYRTADACIGLSPGIVDGIARRGVAGERIAMIPNGCDLDVFSNHCTRGPNAGARSLTCIFAGTHGIANGLEAVLAAAVELKRRRRHDVRILLVGDGKMKSSLVQKAADLELESVQFLDPQPKQQLSELLHSADLGLQVLANVPAFYEGTSPNKFFDYLACGLPVLNNYPGWIARLISSHRCGFVVPPDDPGAFADALIRAADDRAALVEMGLRARALAEEYSRDHFAAEFVGLLEDIVGHGARRVVPVGRRTRP